MDGSRVTLTADVAGVGGRRLLITGATGFLGRHLSRAMVKAGADVHALTRPSTNRRPDLPGVTWHFGDLSDLDSVRALFSALRPTVVFHLAGRVEGRRDIDLAIPMLEANTRDAIHVMIAARSRRPVAWCCPARSRSPAGTTQHQSLRKHYDSAPARLFTANGTCRSVLRIACYGPVPAEQRKVIPYVCRCLIDGTVPSLSSGGRAVDWVHVHDVCDAFARAATTPGADGLVADIGSGEPATVADVVRELARLAGYDGRLGFGELNDRRQDHPRVADTKAAAQHLNWSATTALRDGLASTFQWYSEMSRSNGIVQ